MTSNPRRTLIIPSHAVDPTWLFDILSAPWSGGGHEPDLALMPLDCRPVRVDQWGVDRTGGIS